MFENLSEKQAKLLKYINESWKEKWDSLDGISENDFNFAVQSDTHFSVVTGNECDANNLKALSHFVPLKFIANFGDYIKGYFMGEAGKADNTPDKTMQSLKEITRRYLEDANCPVLITFGNHDTNQLWCKNYGRADQQLTQKDHHDEVIAKLQAHNGSAMVADGDSNYYYVDFPEDGIRIIMLNTTDGCYENEFDSPSQISLRQAEWFEKVALDTDMNILVACHVPLIKEFPGNDSSVVINGDLILNAVEKFIEKGGKFTVYMCGHTHIQGDLIDGNGRLHISFRQGGYAAEVVTLNTKDRVITTKGLSKAENRKYNY